MVPRGGRVLVVGGAGYIGSLLVERLLKDGYRVRVLDSLLYGGESLRPVRGHPDFDLIVGDCRASRDVARAMCDVESVIHLAAVVGDRACDQHQSMALEVNVGATQMLIDCATEFGVNRFLFASTCSVYGASRFEMDEDAAVRPLSLYGQTKVDSERAILSVRSGVLHPTILRLATLFGLGHRLRFDLLVNLLTAGCHKEGVITIYNGHQWRPFLHVRDAVEAITLVLKARLPLVSGQILNLGDARLNYRLADVAVFLRNIFPDVRIEFLDTCDRRSYSVNFDKLQSLTGFRARYTLLDGIEEIKKAFDEELIADYTDVRYDNARYLDTLNIVPGTDQAPVSTEQDYGNDNSRVISTLTTGNISLPANTLVTKIPR